MRLSSPPRRRLSKSKRRELRVRQTRQTRATRLHLQRHYANLPHEARSFFESFSSVFRRPTFLRFAILLVATVLTVGSHTIANVLRTVGRLAPGDPSSYHRFFSCRRWSLRAWGRRLAGWMLAYRVPAGPVYLAADDTVDEHPGDKVYGQGCHRDAVRSSHSYTAFRWGHKWLVLLVLVRIPGASRLGALPIFVILGHSEKEDKKRGRRHQTPPQRLLQAALVLRRWFPEREFILAADGGFASHELTSGIVRLAKKTTYVSRFYAQAALYDPPAVVVLKANGKRPTAGRSRVKGDKRDTPEQVVAKTQERTRLKVSWYGGEDRQVAVVSATGYWYKAGPGLVQVRWVYVHDLRGTHRDEYFYSTDVTMTPQNIIETYTRRW